MTAYAYGTTLETHPSTGAAVRARAMCSDGRVRAVRFGSGQPDTWFSIPGSVVVGGCRVTGYVTVATAEGHDTATDDDPAVVKFRAVRYGRNADALPDGEWNRPAGPTPCGCQSYCHDRAPGLRDCGCGWGDLCEVGRDR